MGFEWQVHGHAIESESAGNVHLQDAQCCARRGLVARWVPASQAQQVMKFSACRLILPVVGDEPKRMVSCLEGREAAFKACRENAQFCSSRMTGKTYSGWGGVVRKGVQDASGALVPSPWLMAVMGRQNRRVYLMYHTARRTLMPQYESCFRQDNHGGRQIWGRFA